MDFTTLRLTGNTASSSASDGKAIGTSEKFYRLFSTAAGIFSTKHYGQLFNIYVNSVYDSSFTWTIYILAYITYGSRRGDCVSQAASAGYVNEFRVDNQNWEKFSLLLAHYK